MKRFIILAVVFCLFAGSASAILDDPNAKTAAKVSIDTNKRVGQLEKTIKDFLGDTIRGIISGAFGVFIYITGFLIKIFYMLFGFIGEILHKLYDFTKESFWPNQYGKAFSKAVALFYTVSAGFIAIAFLMSVMQKLAAGQTTAKALYDIAFAIIALVFFPMIYDLLFTLMGQFSNEIFKIYNSSPSKENIFNALINVGSYFSKTPVNDSAVPWMLGGNFSEKSIADLDSVITLSKEKLQAGDAFFFINQILIFIVCMGGISACLEVILLKGAQLLNLFIAYFTGIFACATLANPGMRENFIQWIIKFIQLLSYNIFWALLLLAVNMLGAKMRSKGVTGAEQIIFLVMILGALKLMPKVGGIVEGFMMSRSVMENFTQQAKMSAMGAGLLATTGIAAAKPLTDTAANAVKGAGAKVGAEAKKQGMNLFNASSTGLKTQGADGQIRMAKSGGGGGGSGGSGQSRAANRPPRNSSNPGGRGSGSGSSGPVSGRTKEQWAQKHAAKRAAPARKA